MHSLVQSGPRGRLRDGGGLAEDSGMGEREMAGLGVYFKSSHQGLPKDWMWVWKEEKRQGCQ